MLNTIVSINKLLLCVVLIFCFSGIVLSTEPADDFSKYTILEPKIGEFNCLANVNYDISLTEMNFQKVANLKYNKNLTKFYEDYTKKAKDAKLRPEILFAIISIESERNFFYDSYTNGFDISTLNPLLINDIHECLRTNLDNRFDCQMTYLINSFKVMPNKKYSVELLKKGAVGFDTEKIFGISQNDLNLAYLTYDDERLAIRMFKGLYFTENSDVCNDYLYVEKVLAYSKYWQGIFESHNIEGTYDFEVSNQKILCINSKLINLNMFNANIQSIISSCQDIGNYGYVVENCKSQYQINVSGKCIDKCKYCSEPKNKRINKEIYSEVCNDLDQNTISQYSCSGNKFVEGSCVKNLCSRTPICCKTTKEDKKEEAKDETKNNNENTNANANVVNTNFGKILVIGDSITYHGTFSISNGYSYDGYVTLLKKDGFTVEGFGFSGCGSSKIFDCMKTGNCRLDACLSSLPDNIQQIDISKYDTVMILMGINDLADCNVNTQRVINNLKETYKYLKEKNKKVIALTILPAAGASGKLGNNIGRCSYDRIKDNVNTINQFINSKPENVNLVIDTYTPLSDNGALKTGLHNGDGLHPNAAGHKVIYETIKSNLQSK